MKLENAIKKIEKMTGNRPVLIGHRYRVNIKRYEVSFMRNGSSEDVTNFYVKPIGANDDVTADYHAGIFFPNLKQALDAAQRW